MNIKFENTHRFSWCLINKNHFILSCLFLSIFGFIFWLYPVFAVEETVCPSDGKTYTVIIRTDDETTTGKPDYNPKTGVQYCLPSNQIKIVDIVNEGIAVSAKLEITEQSIECGVMGTEKTKDGGTIEKERQWVDVKEYSAKDTDVIALDSVTNLHCIVKVTPYKTQRARYKMGTSFIYSMGAPSKTVESKEFQDIYGGVQTKNNIGIWKIDAGATKKEVAEKSAAAYIQFICSTEKDLQKCETHSGCALFEGKCLDISEMNDDDKQKYFAAKTQEALSEKYPVPDGYQGPLPPCAFDGSCRNINDLLQLVINFAQGFFALVGIFAFAFFIYGGFLMITSFGQEERISQGKKTLVTSVLGIIIVFSSYIVVNFVLDALQVGSDFRAINSSQETQ